MQAPYPAHWEADVVLADGGTAHLRPITPGDADRLRAFYSRLSDESIYFRFFGPRPRLSDREVERFTNVDYTDRVALIATIGEEMVAVVRYDRLGPEEAEVAFLVEDAHQGRGLASVLLEHIAAAARERGVKGFAAEVLPANRRMIGVFRQAGYTAESRFADGVVRLTLDLTPTETSLSVMRAREHRAESRSIERLLTPSSVAVVGASREVESIGQTVLRNLLRGDFTGPVYPVHREARAVAGVRAHRSVEEIDGEVDLAVLAVPADGVLDVVRQCARKGVHGLVVVSSGFGETGREGRARQEELVRIARAHGMRVVGPNCLGIANTAASMRLNATLAPELPPRGRAGFFSQSGALGTALLQRVSERGLGISTFVSAGNRADVSGNDLLQYWEEDPATEVILLYLESLGNSRKFTRLARRISRRKPIVAVKSGGVTQGVPIGHAAPALRLPDEAVSALFEQAGVIRVDDLTQLFDVAQLLAHQPLPGGPRVGIVSNSDALALLALDSCVAAGLDPADPVDLGPDATGADYEAAVVRLVDDPGIDSVVAVYMPAVFRGAEEVAEGLRRAAAYAAADPSRPAPSHSAPSHSAPSGPASSHPAPSHPAGPLADRAVTGGEPAEESAAAAGAGRTASAPASAEEGATERLTGPDPAPGAAGPERPAAGRARAGKPIVASYLGRRGMPPELRRDGAGAPARGSVPSYPAPEEAVRALAYAERYAAWRRRSRGEVPAPAGVDAERARALVEAGNADAAELLACYGIALARDGGAGAQVSVTVEADPAFGPVVSFGLADATARLLGDRVYRLAPLTEVEAAEMVRAIRAAPLLFRDDVDVAALEELLVRVAVLADDLPGVHRLALEEVLAGREGVTVRSASLELAEPAVPPPDLGPRRLGTYNTRPR
ncbi:GNAT family N-acetyltransferase [Bailinhaonella thermotolerans]|uniref:bifunctional acetate--CoA ligase family protein/GNAT family N-acetyltransferase n=1 Tax=Bailinhaonella thermotolerans TaxID=1070861 RepID=UPI001F5B6782|nr:GNAT family N-acetyltransferase [Bailinhaonella thermotolerans]